MEIVADTIAEAWEKSMKVFFDKQARYVFTQRGERAKEVLGVQLVVNNPLNEPIISSKYQFGNLFIDDYCDNILSASSGAHSVNSRIVKRKEIGKEQNDQIQKVVSLLSKADDSRRALVCLWDAEYDVNSQHPPCACLIQFILRYNKLDTIAYFRSNDSWMAVLPDMIAICKLSKIVADKLNVKVGKYIHFAASYHLYEPDVIPAQIAFEEQ